MAFFLPHKDSKHGRGNGEAFMTQSSWLRNAEQKMAWGL